jgi:hypothetical protein
MSYQTAAPVRRPSLIGAGIVAEEIENTWEQAMKGPLAKSRQAGEPLPAVPGEPRSEGFCESRVKNAWSILQYIGQVR